MAMSRLSSTMLPSIVQKSMHPHVKPSSSQPIMSGITCRRGDGRREGRSEERREMREKRIDERGERREARKAPVGGVRERRRGIITSQSPGQPPTASSSTSVVGLTVSSKRILATYSTVRVSEPLCTSSVVRTPPRSLVRSPSITPSSSA